MKAKIYNQLDTHDYKDFLLYLKAKGYEFVFFPELAKPTGQIALRHDIDFDCRLAHQNALIEYELGIKASYFFLVSSESYNIGSPQNYRYISEIKEMGHIVSIHFDPVIYQDFEKGFKHELDYFSKLFDVKVDIISLHRPNPFFQEYNQPILGVEHTYQQKFFKDVKYFADSTGIWRFGHPFNSSECNEKQSLHILTHPIWWTIGGSDSGEKIRNHYFSRLSEIKEHYRNNCKTFCEIYDTIQ